MNLHQFLLIMLARKKIVLATLAVTLAEPGAEAVVVVEVPERGLAQAWDAGGSSIIELEGAWPFAYLATAVVVCGACLGLLVRRFVKVGSR